MRLKNFLNFLLVVFLFFFFSIVLFFNFSIKSEQQFSYLAKSFLQGKLYFVEKPGTWADTTPFGNHYYWPQGPMPAILLMPFVLIASFFGQFFYQGYLQFFLSLAVFYFVFKIAQKCQYTFSDCLFLAFAFTFSSAFLGVAIWPWSWFFAQVVTSLLLLLAIFEYLQKKRYFLLGILFALVLVTRVTAGLGVIFFVLEICFIDKGKKLTNLVKLLLPVFVAALFLGFYNFSRFGHFLESGYSRQLTAFPALDKARKFGLFSPIHLPGNLYYFFLSLPLPVFKDELSPVLKFPFVKANHWGMSIFVTSPYFIYLFFLKYKDKLSKLLIITIFAQALPIFLYFSVGGFRQFGYRYSLDFLPFLFLLLIKNYQNQTKVLLPKFKILILFSALLNLFLFPTIFY